VVFGRTLRFHPIHHMHIDSICNMSEKKFPFKEKRLSASFEDRLYIQNGTNGKK